MDSTNICMTWDSFVNYVVEIKTLSDELHDEWEFHGESDNENSIYISKKLHKTFQPAAIDEELINFEEDADEDIPNMENKSVLLTLEYHVAFHPTYSCPILCLNAWNMNGSLLTLEECWQHLGFSDCDYKYNMLTQMDHPVLMRPFLTVHPCKTGDLIGTSFHKSKNPIVSWLSAVAPIFGLKILPEYAKLTF
ncbi:hypothetical protein ILUMI_02356 [Ignelater luminosus]|uniref:Ubiquitin-like-conjugating enzyme ATG10 n=1 Tax=Ignelater luminosus TaxID=2038154 RepID=A0A8K0DDJ8_IGNLU|nr:hypothetical protein ILUMI_02356 [Ignelater luminosus]